MSLFYIGATKCTNALTYLWLPTYLTYLASLPYLPISALTPEVAVLHGLQ